MNETQEKFPLFKAGVLLFILICLIYSNTLHSPWFLDDFHNITQNPKIYITRLSAETIKHALYAAPTQESLYRPVSYLTFALNWYWGQDDVWGYHLVNIAIHMLAAFFLFFTLILIFQTRHLKDCEPSSIYFVALLSSAIWAIHPIQIQAVTYIIQRMASLAALFYIIAIFCFLKARLSYSLISRLLFFGLCGICFLLGIGAKNNAILLPVSLVLIEFIFFRDLAQRSTRIRAAVAIAVGAMLIAAAGFFLYFEDNLDPLLKGYEFRPYTITERLLTQPRVLLFYLSQIFYPTADRFSLTHDFNLSTSLFTPWTTLPAILLVLLLIGLALWRIRKNPLFSLAVLFFFGNHVIESSILPLEMVFEHRNYLPSFFLFVPISFGIKKMIDHYQSVQKWMYYFLVISICAGIIGIGSSAYIRNLDWQSNKSFWQDAMHKAPKSSRPLQNLAWGYYTPTGQIDKAIELYLKALSLQCDTIDCEFFSYNNLVSIYYFRLHDYQKAVEYLEKISETVAKDEKSDLMLSQALIKTGRYFQANTHLERLISKNPNNHNALYLKGIIFLKQSSYSKAYQQFRQCLRRDPGNWRYLREIGVCLTHMGYHDRGYWFLKQAGNLFPKNDRIILSLADNRCRAGMTDQAEEWIELLLDGKNPNDLENAIQDITEDDAATPLIRETILLVSKKIQKLADKYSQSADQLIGLYPFRIH